VSVFDAESGDEWLVVDHSSRANDARFSPDESIIATVGIGTANTIYIWDGMTGQRAGAIRTHHRDTITSIVFSSDGTLLASVSRDSTVQIYDLKVLGLVAD